MGADDGTGARTFEPFFYSAADPDRRARHWCEQENESYVTTEQWPEFCCGLVSLSRAGSSKIRFEAQRALFRCFIPSNEHANPNSTLSPSLHFLRALLHSPHLLDPSTHPVRQAVLDDTWAPESPTNPAARTALYDRISDELGVVPRFSPLEMHRDFDTNPSTYSASMALLPLFLPRLERVVAVSRGHRDPFSVFQRVPEANIRPLTHLATLDLRYGEAEGGFYLEEFRRLLCLTPQLKRLRTYRLVGIRLPPRHIVNDPNTDWIAFDQLVADEASQWLPSTITHLELENTAITQRQLGAILQPHCLPSLESFSYSCGHPCVSFYNETLGIALPRVVLQCIEPFRETIMDFHLDSKTYWAFLDFDLPEEEVFVDEIEFVEWAADFPARRTFSLNGATFDSLRKGRNWKFYRRLQKQRTAGGFVSDSSDEDA